MYLSYHHIFIISSYDHIFIVDIDAFHYFYKTKNINLFLPIIDQPIIDNKNYVSIIHRRWKRKVYINRNYLEKSKDYYKRNQFTR